MSKAGKIKICTELLVQAIQDVQVERRGDTLVVVIGCDQRRLVFHEIRSQKERIFAI